ncbi:MAG TPA: DUF4180 domain-containing protein [Blastocatellia bacterium]|nr:DUF4180 domain-containing protein [Blastocatellia bacterium]
MNRELRIIIAGESGLSVRCLGDLSDVIGACFGADGLILDETDLGGEFFDLRSGLAGELIQKFVNYRLRVAIVVAAPEVYGGRFGELAYEHATHDIVRFVHSKEEATGWLRRRQG